MDPKWQPNGNHMATGWQPRRKKHRTTLTLQIAVYRAAINCGSMRLRRGRVRLTARECVPATRDMRLAAREKFNLSEIGFPLHIAIFGENNFSRLQSNLSPVSAANTLPRAKRAISRAVWRTLPFAQANISTNCNLPQNVPAF